MSKSMKGVFILLFLFILSTPSLLAQNGVNSHDGLFMRFLVGPSYAQMTVDNVGGKELKFSGFSGAFRFQIGAEISENLIAFGELGGVTITNPDAELDGKTYDTKDTKASAFDFGGGMTYYFMPSNFYISGSVLASRVQLEYNKNKAESDIGFGFIAKIGKEWWVADDWGLGVAVFGYYSSVPDKDPSDATIANTAFGVLFSATFN